MLGYPGDPRLQPNGTDKRLSVQPRHEVSVRRRYHPDGFCLHSSKVESALGKGEAWVRFPLEALCGCSLKVKHLSSKQKSRVRFPLPAPCSR